MVVARVKESNGHILQTLLSDTKQNQQDGEHEPQSNQTQTLLGLGAQAGLGGEEVLSANCRVLQSNLDTPIANALYKSQRSLRSVLKY